MSPFGHPHVVSKEVNSVSFENFAESFRPIAKVFRSLLFFACWLFFVCVYALTCLLCLCQSIDHYYFVHYYFSPCSTFYENTCPGKPYQADASWQPGWTVCNTPGPIYDTYFVSTRVCFMDKVQLLPRLSRNGHDESQATMTVRDQIEETVIKCYAFTQCMTHLILVA